MNRQEFMMNALGADEDTMVEVLTKLLASADLAFTVEEEQTLRMSLGDPEMKLQVATILTDGALKAGAIE